MKAVKLLLMACLALTLAACSRSSEPPKSLAVPPNLGAADLAAAQQLADQFKQARASHDEAGIYNLVYWRGVDDFTRNNVVAQFKADMNLPLRSVAVLGLSSQPERQYSTGGKTYRLSLEPLAQLQVVSIPPADQGPVRETRFWLGKHDGKFYITLTEPVTQ